jgi:hypothetical protein
VATKDKAFALIRDLHTDQDPGANIFKDSIHKGTVSTNVYLRRIHNFALDMSWLPKSRSFPNASGRPSGIKDKRAITFGRASVAIVEPRERIRSAKKFYELCWHLGGSQGDLACSERPRTWIGKITYRQLHPQEDRRAGAPPLRVRTP